MSTKRWMVGVSLLAAVGLAVGCWGAPESEPEGKGKKGKKAKVDVEEPAPPKADPGPAEPLPTLLVTQAVFATEGGKPKPQPATLVLLRNKGDSWFRVELTDPDSNVFHKAIAWREGILTIGAMKAVLKHWTKGADGTWSGKPIWAPAPWGGKFDRLRDLEIGDVDADGKDDLVIATHDQGVVAVGREAADGTWAFVEVDKKPDTFVHEIEIGDVDGDGKKEFYATPSGRNRASGESQPGSVYRYDPKEGTFVSSVVVDYVESHAKEILVHDLDGDGKDELYVVREAHTVKEGATTKRVDPVRIVRYTPSKKGWTEQVVATLEDDQCRFLVPGDVDGDGKKELVAAGFKSGLWVLEPQADGTFTPSLIDGASGGFEHATHVADLDGNGQVEIYVAADEQKEFRRYTWNGTSFDKKVLAPIGPAARSHITWNLQDGVF